MDPEAARIVTVDVVDDEPPVEVELPAPELTGAGPGEEDADWFPAPPPQLCNVIPAPSTRHKIPNLWIPLRRPVPSTSAATGNSSAQATAKNLDSGTVELATEAGVESVRLALAVVDPGVTEAGLKLHVAPAGSPEQERATALLNAPFCAATVME